MNPNLTGKAYDTITHLWEGDSFNIENGIEQHKKALAFVDARGKALDVGCGCNGRFLKLLTRERFSYEGLDVSEKMINLAQQRHADIVFYQEDICEWKSAQKYDFITAWDSIWHVPLDRQEHVIRKLVSALSAGGVLIFSFGGTEESGDHTNEVMGPMVYYSTLGTNKYLELLSKIGCICRHVEYDQYPESHAYVIAQKTA